MRDFPAFWLSWHGYPFLRAFWGIFELVRREYLKFSARAFGARELDFIFVDNARNKCDILVCDFPTFWFSCPSSPVFRSFGTFLVTRSNTKNFSARAFGARELEFILVIAMRAEKLSFFSEMHFAAFWLSSKVTPFLGAF